MTLKEKLYLLEELLDIEEGTLSEEIELNILEQWDSIAVISLIAMFDDKFGKVLTSQEIKKFKTVKDIIREME